MTSSPPATAPRESQLLQLKEIDEPDELDVVCFGLKRNLPRKKKTMIFIHSILN